MMTTTLNSPCVQRRLLVMLVLAGLSCVPVRAAEYAWQSRSVWWEPYRWSTEADFLFHFDDKRPYKGAEWRFLSRQEQGAAEAGAGPGLEDLAPSTSAHGVANAKPMGQAGVLSGAVARCEDGRFGGGLRFTGGDGVLRLPGERWRTGCTVEFWVQPDGLPTEPAALYAIQLTRDKEGRGVALDLMPDGALRLSWLGKASAPTATKLEPGKWTHVAFRYAGKYDNWGYPEHAEIVLNGVMEQRTPIGLDLPPSANKTALFSIGNDHAQRRGFRGVIDEVRFSHIMQDYARQESPWVDPQRPLKPKHQHPYLRDAADMLFHVPFDNTMEPARAAPGTQMARSFEPDDALDDSDYLLPSVAQQGLVLGEGGLAPKYKGEGNIDMARGSIAFWMRPLDWDNLKRFSPFDNGEPAFINLFHVVGDFPQNDGPARWRRGQQPILRFVVFQNMQQDVVNPPEISPARWIHMTVTWDKTDVRYYVDGKLTPGGGPVSPFTIVTPDNDYWLWGPPGRPPAESYAWRTKAQSIVFNAVRGSLWHPFWYVRKQDPHTLIDDFRIYRRALGPAEVRNLVALYTPQTEPLPLPVADLEYKLNGQAAVLDVEAFPFMQDYGKIERVRFSLQQRGQPAPVVEKVVDFKPMEHPVARLTAKPLEFATYDLVADFQGASGASIGKFSREIVRVKPPWWGNRYGLSEKVMPEWDPMKVAGNVVSVVHRDIHVGASGLPERIVSKGGELLVNPVSIEAVVNGTPARLIPERPTPSFGPANDVRVDWQGSVSGNGIVLKTQAYMEFDGMMWFTLTLSATGSGFRVQEEEVKAQVPGAASGSLTPEPRTLNPVLNSLSIRIPFTPRDAELLHCWSGVQEQPPEKKFPTTIFIDATPAGQGVVFRSNDTNMLARLVQQRGSFAPYLCLMGMERGMAFFGENDRGWTPSMATPALAVERNGASVDLVLNLISEPVTLGEPRVIEFGLHPLPLRKLQPDWRRWPGWGVPMDCGLKGDTSIWNSLLPKDADWSKVAERWKSDPGCQRTRQLLEASWADFRKSFGRDPTPYEKSVPGVYTVLPYPGWVPEHTREFHELWWTGNVKGAVPDRAFVEFSAWCWQNWVDTGVVEGFYIDGDGMGTEIADRGNLAYTLPDGHVQPGYGWRHIREHHKRMRQILWDRKIVPHICNHMTQSPYAPIESFVDVMLDGEWGYQSPPEQRDFLDVWPPARMRISHVGKWQVLPKWLGWHGGPSWPQYPAWVYRHDRAHVANLGAHDIDWLFWGTYAGVEAASEVRLREPDTEFVGYWTEGAVARHEYGENVLVSAWKAPARDGKAPLCTVLIVNRGNKRLDPATLRFDTARMGLGSDPEAVTVEDIDPGLLDPAQYKDDPTTLTAAAMPVLPSSAELMDVGEAKTHGADIELEEKDAYDLGTPAGRLKHPDYRFQWSKGELTCAVRRHDYRFFKFSPAGTPAPQAVRRPSTP